jgi:hypothetical protein
MRTAGQKKPYQQTRSASSDTSLRASPEQDHDESSILRLQRTIGNQAVQRMLRAVAQRSGSEPAAMAAGVPQSIGRILANSKVGGSPIHRLAQGGVGDANGSRLEGDLSGVQPAGSALAVQRWGKEHKDFTGRAVDRWNGDHPKGTYQHIPQPLKAWMVKCSDDPDHTGRVLTGTVSDLGIYYDFIVKGKKKRREQYAKASESKKKELYAAAEKAVSASEGPTHGEGSRPKYGSGGASVNSAYMMSEIKLASWLVVGGFMSRAAAGQLGDAMHCAQDRGSHGDGNRGEGHDDVRDKLGIGGFDTDDPKRNTAGKEKADDLSDKVLEEYAKLRPAKAGK